LSRHRVDTSVMLSVDDFEPRDGRREIEVMEVDLRGAAGSRMELLAPEPYLPSEELVEAVNLAIALGRPLLLQGDPGCGKTRLAHAVAYVLGLPLEECYIKSTTRAQDLLYTYDAVNRLYDAQFRIAGRSPGDGQAPGRDARDYIRLGPLGRAIARGHHGRRSVVLLDEIDKADLDFPNDLLYELDRLAFQVAEAPELRFAVGDRPDLRPIVFVTHNEEKALPTAFLRRCVFHHVRFPEDEAALRRILALHQEANEPLSRKAIEVVLRLRAPELNLNKKPALSELIDWVGFLAAVNASPERLDDLPYIGALLKQQGDLERAARGTGG
jgi:MoxR-like ATPase